MIVVTGGAGFIGSNLLAGLEGRGATDLILCDRLGSGEKWRNIAKREIRDIVPPDRLPDFLDANAAEVEMVFHLGAVSSTTARDVNRIVATNFTLSLQLWQWCARNDVRFVYASSAATYGDGSAGFDDDGSIEGLAKLRPLNAYGWSKHLFDRRAARSIRNNRRVPPQWAGLKLFNVYGPNEYHKGDMASVIPRVHEAIVAGQPARLFKSYRTDFEDGGQRRDFIWVGDCVAVMLWLLDNRQVSGLFNVGTGRARSFRELAEAIFAAAGAAPSIEYVDMPEELRGRYQYLTEARVARLRQAGFTADFTDLETGVAAYVRRYLSQPDLYL